MALFLKCFKPGIEPTKDKDNKFTYVLYLYRMREIEIGIVMLIFSGSSYVVEVAWCVLGYVVELV